MAKGVGEAGEISLGKEKKTRVDSLREKRSNEGRGRNRKPSAREGVKYMSSTAWRNEQGKEDPHEFEKKIKVNGTGI